MSYSTLSFKRTLGFASLVVLASLVCFNQSFAMESADQHSIMQSHETLTLKGVETLIINAKYRDPQAQDALMKISYQGLYGCLLMPEKIDFLSWKRKDRENIVENKCYHNDFYVSFMIRHFEKLEAHFDFPKLFDITKKRADQGDANAQSNLGFMYAQGLGAKKNEKEAYNYYKLAADQGHAVAQNSLGFLFEQQDEKKVYNYHKLVADQGYAAAQNSLGCLFEQGFGVTFGVAKNEKEAFKYYKLSADQGHPEAQFNLSNMYADGIGVDKDEEKANRYYKLAADQGHVFAQYSLGCFYIKGLGVEKDEKEGCWYFKLAADQGHAVAQNNLSLQYLQGIGVDKDDKEAFRYCKLAADQGNLGAQYSIGGLYAAGKGVDKNVIEALHWAMESKHPTCQSFIRKSLLLVPNTPLEGDVFPEILIEFMAANNPNMNKEGAVARLLMSHQFKIGMNKKCFSESTFAIPELGKMYESIETSIADINNMMESLATIKPGFMVTVVSLSEEMKTLLPNQITSFFSLNEIDGVSYLTMGEENVCKVKRFVGFLEKFEQAEHTLAKIAHLYSQGLAFTLQELKRKQPLPEDDCMNLAFIKDFTTAFKEQEEECNKFRSFLEKNEEQQTKFDLSLGKLMVRQHLTRIEILHEDGMAMTVKEHFKCLTCPNNSVEAFKEQEDKFEDLVLYLKLPLEEIEAERALLRELHKQIKDLPSRGVGSRNKDLFEEYSILR